ncbi:MAG: PhzF family phenazine biosynthesis protein [Actinomycetota bacterium]
MGRIVWVDVFAPRPLSGNPLAVVLEPEDLDTERMQRLAAELGLSETVFVFPPDSPSAAARLRIFTPAAELPVAGHPVVGAAWVMHAAGDMSADGVVETGVGPLRVRVSGQVATMMQATPEAGALVDADEVAAACGVAAAGAGEAPAPAQVWSTGVPQLMLPVADTEVLAGARPDAAALARLGERDGWRGVSLYTLTGRDAGRVEAQVRHFAPGIGVLEDPATGSAAGGLGSCLAAAGLGDGAALQLVVRQGAEMGRPGEIAVRVTVQGGVPRRVQVGGRVVPLFQGRLIRL